MAVISISRQFGTGGKTLGKRLSERLGYTYVDKDIIRKIAQQVKVSYDDVLAFEKSGASKLTRFLDKVVSKDFIERLISDKHGYMDEKQYVDTLKAIIQGLYAQGNMVILGRGAQYILRGMENTWHILLVAEEKHRVQFLMDAYESTRQQAHKTIRENDKVRTLLLGCFEDKSFHDDPVLYDLVINMTRVSIEQAEEMVLNLVSS